MEDTDTKIERGSKHMGTLRASNPLISRDKLIDMLTNTTADSFQVTLPGDSKETVCAIDWQHHPDVMTVWFSNEKPINPSFNACGSHWIAEQTREEVGMAWVADFDVNDTELGLQKGSLWLYFGPHSQFAPYELFNSFIRDKQRGMFSGKAS